MKTAKKWFWSTWTPWSTTAISIWPFFPTLDEDVDPDEAEESEDYGLIIMRVETVNGEDELVTLEDEDEAEAVYNVFMEEAFSEDEDEE